MQESGRDQVRGHDEENYSEPATVSDRVPVRPETPAESAILPVVFGNEELDHTESSNGLYHYNRVVIRHYIHLVEL